MQQYLTQSPMYDKLKQFGLTIKNFNARYEDVDELVKQRSWLLKHEANPKLLAEFDAELCA